MLDFITCYVCDYTMNYIETKDIELLGKCKVYKCNKCGEVVYEPIKK